MTATTVLIILAAWILAALIGWEVYRRWSQSQRTRQRLFVERGGEGARPPIPPEKEPSGLGRWLFLAGYRTPGATFLFFLATLASIGFGLLFVFVLQSARAFDGLLVLIQDGPPQIYRFIETLVRFAPYAVVVLFALIPWLIVRGSRRRIVAEVEMDLPVTLELLATLAESGLSFDAALDRVLRSQREDRALQRELRTFQAEILAGRPRIECLRRLSRRVEVPSFSSFISAVAQAENTGSGIAAALRRQANDLRGRRRERAMEFAMALPVKRLIPMIVCFLPALLLAALGPAIFEVVEYVNSFLESRSL